MKKLVFTCLVIAVIFAACKKEEETPTNNNNSPTTYAFSCKIDGVDFTDNNPVATITQDDVLTIDAENGANSIRFMIYFFSTRAEGEEIPLNILTDKVYVNLGTDYYSTTIGGTFIFSEIGDSISGTFDDVICNNSQNAVVTVTDGAFVDVAY